MTQLIFVDGVTHQVALADIRNDWVPEGDVEVKDKDDCSDLFDDPMVTLKFNTDGSQCRANGVAWHQI